MPPVNIEMIDLLIGLHIFTRDPQKFPQRMSCAKFISGVGWRTSLSNFQVVEVKDRSSRGPVTFSWISGVGVKDADFLVVTIIFVGFSAGQAKNYGFSHNFNGFYICTVPQKVDSSNPL